MRNTQCRAVGLFVALTLFSCAIPCVLQAQWIGKQTGCYASPITANPNRPTVANPADITQFGVLELEYGWDRASTGAGARVSDLEGLLKFGLLCDVELRWTMTNLLVENDSAGGQTGTGDNSFGAQVRLYKQTPHAPTLAISYAAKAPTASEEKGLGSGRVDHSLTFLASKDISGVHFDFNTTAFFIGQPARQGFDLNFQFNLSLSRPIKGSLGFTGEFYGNTELNSLTPGFASTLWALTYNVSPRLVLDGGIDTGLSHGATQKRFFVGMTYSIANLYPGFKRHQASVNSAKDTK
jgi:hypothetical protein